MADNVFEGRSLCVSRDLSRDEQLYLFKKGREYKEAEAKEEWEKIEQMMIQDPRFGVYAVFLENSTRTRESSLQAAMEHDAKIGNLNVQTSSFDTKHEGYFDGIKNLWQYRNHVFLIRSKVEGLCRWLERGFEDYTSWHRENTPNFNLNPPIFINCGDGKHEHPTQELLDEFTFMEQYGFDDSHIHIALIGDLLNGRTLHSKADGLKVFQDVRVDCVAPELLQMPQSYLDRMRENGFEVRLFESLDEYYEKGDVAPSQYFSRFQKERMGDLADRVDAMKKDVTFRPEHVRWQPDGMKIYHPQPFDETGRTVPDWVDMTEFNGYDPQSANGKVMRFIYMAAAAGRIGEDFEGTPVIKPDFVDDFITEVSVFGRPKREYDRPIRPISKGVVIDHICRGESPRNIRRYLAMVEEVMDLNQTVYTGVDESEKEPGVYKGMLFIPGEVHLDDKDRKRIAAVIPGSTVNVIEGMDNIDQKLRLGTPPRVYNIEGLQCMNDACITRKNTRVGVPVEFHRRGDGKYGCMYCDKEHTFKEIWGGLSLF